MSIIEENENFKEVDITLSKSNLQLEGKKKRKHVKFSEDDILVQDSVADSSVFSIYDKIMRLSTDDTTKGFDDASKGTDDASQDNKIKDLDDGDESNSDSSSSIDNDNRTTTLQAEFLIDNDDVLQYWNSTRRTFFRDKTGRDWPMMYRSPCAVIISYVHVKSFNSRKRNAAFAHLNGVCSICDAVHKYVITSSPFRETINASGTHEYQVIKGLSVVVSVTGTFHRKDGKPDLTQPVHLTERAKGLDLRGEERNLIAMKASMEGAKSVYREGMAFLQKEQIESSNRTSVRSLPVIK